MSESPGQHMVPLSRRRAGLGPVADGPFEGIPAHLAAPLTEWLHGVFRPDGQNLARDVAIRLRVPVPRQDYAPQGSAVNYLQAVFRYASSGDDESLDVIDAVLQLHPGWPRPVRSGQQILIQSDGAWDGTVTNLEHILQAADSVYEVSRDLRRLEMRIDPTVRESVRDTLSLAHTARERASQRLARAWELSYGLHPDPSAAVAEAVKAVESVAIPLFEPSNSDATLGTVVSKLRDPNFAAKFRLELWQDKKHTVDGPEPLAAVMATVWFNHHDRHEGNEPAPTVPPETARAVLHAASLAVQWLVTDVVSRRTEI